MSHLKFTSLLTLLALICGQSYSFEVHDCAGNKAGAKITSITFSCQKSASFCTLVKGTNATIEIDFDTVHPFTQAHAQIFGKLGPISIPFPLKSDDACISYGLQCPALVNAAEKLRMTFPVLRTYPTINVKVQLRLLSETRRPTLCIEFPARVSDKAP